MMTNTGKSEAGSFKFILLNISIFLVSYSNIATSASLPSAPVLSATTSSSTSASGLPLPPSKMPPANVQGSLDAKMTATNEMDSRTGLPNELQNQAMERQTANSMQTAESQIAHNQQEEASPETTLGEESNSANGGMSKAISDEKAASFVDFPPFAKQIAPEPRYQRQRRSYHVPSLNQLDGPRPEEIELRLDDEKDRDAFLRLMSVLLSTGNGNRIGDAPTNDDLPPLFLNPESMDAQNEDLDGIGSYEDAIDLGAFERPVASPYYTPSLGRPNEPINVMASMMAADTPRFQGGHRAHYGLREGLPSLPLDTGIVRRALSLRDEDENDNGEWMEEAVPLHGSHYKARRSGPVGNTEFTFNPVKSHFRRYMRAVPLKSGRGLEFMNSGGHFGPIVSSASRFNRRRRAVSAMAAHNGQKFPTVHWM